MSGGQRYSFYSNAQKIKKGDVFTFIHTKRFMLKTMLYNLYQIID